eukprot:COSAG03_NODE_1208_length_4558_cov_3.427226_4_plen_94_part_00
MRYSKLTVAFLTRLWVLTAYRVVVIISAFQLDRKTLLPVLVAFGPVSGSAGGIQPSPVTATTSHYQPLSQSLPITSAFGCNPLSDDQHLCSWL